MSDSDFYTPTDIDALRMENELLAFEVEFLKARLDEAEGEKHDSGGYSKETSEMAEKDLRLILEKISRSRLAPLFRLRSSFRVLEQRYLKDQDS